jgi:hypothetical protein
MSLSRLVGQLSRAQQYMAWLAVPESFSRGSWSPSPLFSHLQLPWQDHLTFTVSREERRLSHQRWCSVLNVWVLVPKCVWAVLHLPSHTLKWLYRVQFLVPHEQLTGYTSRNFFLPCEISSSHGGRYKAHNLLGCTAMFLIECRPTFQRYVLPPSSGQWVSLERKDNSTPC